MTTSHLHAAFILCDEYLTPPRWDPHRQVEVECYHLSEMYGCYVILFYAALQAEM